jgi:hypothetical protein
MKKIFGSLLACGNIAYSIHITADIHGMGPFGLILAPKPYNKLER